MYSTSYAFGKHYFKRFFNSRLGQAPLLQSEYSRVEELKKVPFPHEREQMLFP